MKTTRFSDAAMSFAALLVFLPVFSQEDQPARPAYITVTTMQWDMDNDYLDPDSWKALETEYFDKVTSRNELVAGSGFYTHLYSPDSRDVLVVNHYAKWEDIAKAGERNQELINEGWPDEAARNEFFRKRNAYYTDLHSDEIYAPMQNAIVHDRKTTPVLLVRRNYMKLSGNEIEPELDAYLKEVYENVFKKNEFIKGYYPSRHAWGSNSTEYLQVFFVNSLADVDAMGDRNGELSDAYWSDEVTKKEVAALRKKFFTGVHGDYIYSVVTELIK
jgi:hypothetical protein